MASNIFNEPPSFVSEDKSMAEYEADLRMWSRLTSLKPEQHAEAVVFYLGKQKNQIKDKIMTAIGDKLTNNKDGLEELIKFLKTIYSSDEMADSYEKYVNFEKRVRKKEEKLHEFIADWENLYNKTESKGCKIADMVLAFKLLKACDLTDIETNLVLTGVNFAVGKEKENMLEQVKESLRKFVGRSNISGEDKTKPVAVKEENTYVTKEELTLLLKGANKRNRTRSKSHGDVSETGRNPNYKGKKNPLGRDFKPLKCFKCKCECKEACTCPCVYHLADKCPGKKENNQKKTEESGQGGSKPDVSLYMKTLMRDSTYLVSNPTQGDHRENNESLEDFVLITESLSTLCLLTKNEKRIGIVDCACPTTVAGVDWMVGFNESLDERARNQVCIEPSNRMFKFGGGEKRSSLHAVTIPCKLGEINVKIKVEVVEAEIPLLIGNSTLKKAQSVIDISKKTITLMGQKISLEESESGHWIMEIKLANIEEMDKNVAEELILLTKNVRDKKIELSEKNIEKLHNYLGHAHSDKLKKLVKNADLLNEDVSKQIEKIYADCESCKIFRNRQPKPAVTIPKATKPNEVVSLDLKVFGEGDMKYILYMVCNFSRFTMGCFIPKKEPKIIAEALLANWVKIFGRMDYIHTDRGGGIY